jgi:hypothetical protein
MHEWLGGIGGVGIPHIELKVSGNLDAARKINVDTHRYSNSSPRNHIDINLCI